MDYSINEKLFIRTDLDLSNFFVDLPSYFRKDFDGTPDLEILKNKFEPKNIDYVFPPYVYYGKNILLHKYGFPVPCQLTLENLEGKTKIQFTDAYLRFVGLWGIVSSVIDLKLLQKELVKIHGSCVELPDKKGLMVVGWDHCGKSTLAFNMVNGGAKFLSDDITLFDENFAYSYPKDIKTFKGMNRLVERLNTTPFINRLLKVNKNVIPKNVAEKTRVKYIFVSRHGKKNIRNIELKELIKIFETLNIYVTVPFDKRNIVLDYCFYSKYDLSGLLKSRYKIIEKFLKDVECFEITSTNVKDSEDLIKKTIKS